MAAHDKSIDISVMMPTYNEAENILPLIDETVKIIESGVICQSLEIIVIDDNSPDGTWKLVQSHDDPRVRVIHDDPRRFLSRSRDSYDLVLLLEPDPLTLLRARLTTVEFYRMCRARMAPTGVLVVTVKTAPNVLTGQTAALGGALFRALGEVFPVVKATPGPDSLFVAGTSAEVVTLEPTQLAARWVRRGLVSDVFAGELFPLRPRP